MKTILRALLLLLPILLLTACMKPETVPPTANTSTATVAAPLSTTAATEPNATAIPARAELAARYQDKLPTAWGENLEGILRKIDTQEQVLYLTFDACKAGYDKTLIDFLVQNQIPCTLFLTGCWVRSNPEHAAYLAQQRNFQIENHGDAHKPLSVNGRSAYKLAGTRNAGEVYDEIEQGAAAIAALTGIRPQYLALRYFKWVRRNPAQQLRGKSLR